LDRAAGRTSLWGVDVSHDDGGVVPSHKVPQIVNLAQWWQMRKRAIIAAVCWPTEPRRRSCMSTQQQHLWSKLGVITLKVSPKCRHVLENTAAAPTSQARHQLSNIWFAPSLVIGGTASSCA